MMPDNFRIETIGNSTLYCADCMEVMPVLADLGGIDAVVTDPPYGIGETNKKNLSRHRIGMANDYGEFSWDQSPASAEQISAILSCSTHQIIFGGNYFDLPPTSCWLVWDKQNGASDFADCELAWTNLQKAVRRIRWQWSGFMRRGERGFNYRDHPTQKPIGVMTWCIEHLPADAKTILDPFMGSGTTGVACAKLGRHFIGIEQEPKYFDIACKRIEEAYRQPDMFIEPPPKPVQNVLNFADG